MDKPFAAIERMRLSLTCQNFKPEDATAILAYLDSIPEGAVPVVWPKELTRERLEELARGLHGKVAGHQMDALHALAAIAPVRKKRVVELWIHERGQKEWLYSDDKWTAQRATMPGWKCVARNVELED